MGIYDRDYYRKEGPSFLDPIIPDGRVCRWLIGLNVGIFVLQLLFQRAFGLGLPNLDPGAGAENAEALSRWLHEQMSGPVTRWLELDTGAVARGEIWRLLTYAFLHDPHSIWHLAVNMLFLWWFGTDVEMIYGPREFLGFYLLSALLGGVAFQLWAMTQATPTMYCVGASGAITAVLVLCACHYPHRTILIAMLIPVPIWFFVVFSVAQDLYRLYMYQTFVSHVASVVHLAGAGFGFIYFKQQWRVLNWLPGFHWRWKPRTRRNLRLYRPEDEKEAVSVAATGSTGNMDEHLEAKLDAVLEKVSRHGQESLTEKERMILMRASEIYKRKRT